MSLTNVKKQKTSHIKYQKQAARFGGYIPTKEEPFMNERQQAYFRHKLLMWKTQIAAETGETVANLRTNSKSYADIYDRASLEADRHLELRSRERQRKLAGKIDAALKRIDEGTYGYCEETGDAITIERLDARPIATLCLEAQERHERKERTHRND